MKKNYAILNVTIIMTLIAISVAVMCTTLSNKSSIVKANEGKDVIPYTREDGSGTKSAFITMTGLEEFNWLGEREDTSKEDIPVINSSKEMITQISDTKDSIGYVSYAVEKNSDIVKELTVNGIAPTIDNIKNESYPLLRDFQLVYNGKMTDIEKDFLQYVKSEGQGYISDYCVPARSKGIFLPNDAAGELAISGSTSMTPMMNVLAQKYMAANPNATVTVKSSDSESGMMDVLQGNSNFGMVSRDLKSYEKEMLSSERIGRDAIAIIVNPENVVDDVTVKQLKKIYNGSITSWGYLKIYK